MKSANRIIGSLLIVFSIMQEFPTLAANLIIYGLFYLMALVYLIITKQLTISIDYYLIFSVVWIAYSVLGYIWSIHVYFWLRNTFILIIIFIAILVFRSLIRTTEDALFFSKVWFLLVIVANGFGWLEIFSGRYLFSTGTNILRYSVVKWPMFTFTNANDYSTYVAISLPLASLYSLNNRRNSWRIANLLLIASCIIMFLKIDSRANVLGLLAGLIVFVILYYVNKKYHTIMFFIALSLVLLAMVVIIFVSFLRDNINYNFLSRSDQTRITLILTSLSFLKSTYFVGVGAGNLNHYLDIYSSIYFKQPFSYVHNWWIEVLVNFGVPIFIGYLIFWVKLFYTNLLSASNKSKTNAILSSALVVFVICSISPHSILLMKWLPLFTGFVVGSTAAFNKRNDYFDTKIMVNYFSSQ